MTRMTKPLKRQLRLANGKHHGEPVCDNCAWMTIVRTGSGNHRHCDLMGLYIPDREQSPSCTLHTWTNSTSRTLVRKGVKWETETVQEGGAR